MTDLLTDDDLKAIEERVEAATVGPWGRGENWGPPNGGYTLYGPAPDNQDYIADFYAGHHEDDRVTHDTGLANVNFIAAARTDIPRLIASLRHERAQREALEQDSNRLYDALKNLNAMVWGECPSLLEDDHHAGMIRETLKKHEELL